MRRPTILLAALLLLPGAIRAQEEPEARRRVVYVPHEDFDAVVKKHGQGVLLSVPEYLALYEQAMASGFEPAARPAADAVILSGALTGTLADEGFALTAVFRIRSLAEGIVRVPCPLHGAAVHEAALDGKPALLSADAAGGFVLVPEKGEHELRLVLKGRPGRSPEGVRGMYLALAPSAFLTFDLTLPPGVDAFSSLPALVLRTLDVPDGVRAVGSAPPGGVFALSWRPRSLSAAETPLLHASGRTLHRVGMRRVETASIVEITIHRQPVREVVLAVPPEEMVTEVGGRELADYRLEPGGRVVLRFARTIGGGPWPVAIRTERPLTGPGEVTLPAVTVPDAADERGFVAVAFEPGVRGRVAAVDGLSREAIPAPPPPERNRLPDASELLLTGSDAAYRYWARGRSLSVRTEEAALRVSCTVTAVLALAENYRTLQVDLDYRAEGGRVFEVAPSFPAGYEFLSAAVEAPVPHRHEGLVDGVLRVQFPAGVPPGTPLRLTVQLIRTVGWLSLEEELTPVPVPGAGPGVEIEGRLAVLADEEFEVRDRDLTGLATESVDRLGFPSARLGYTWRKGPAGGTLAVSRRTPEVSVRQVAVVAPGQKSAVYSGYLHYTIRRAGVRVFRFTVPGGHGDRLHVSGPGTIDPVRKAGPDGADLWEVSLPKPVRGDVIIRLSLEADYAVGEGPRTFAVPEVKVLDVDDETGYLAVETGDNLEVTGEPVGLRGIGTEEMEPVFAQVGHVAGRGVLAAWQYAAHPWSLAVGVLRHEDAPLLAAFVRQAKIMTVVAADGTTRTRASYVLLNAGSQFLRVVLPAGSALWGAFVAGQPVKPAAAGGEILVPLGRSGAEPVPVVLVYEGAGSPLSGAGRLALDAPTLVGVPGAEAEWSVWLPAGYRVTETDGVFGAAPPPLPEPWLFRFLAAGLATGGDRATAAAAVETAAGRYRGPGGEVPPRSRDPHDPAPPPERPGAEHSRATRGAESAPVDDPMLRDAKVEDHNESDNDLPMDESKPGPQTPAVPAKPGEDTISDAPFEGPSTNAAIGIGGGSGGAFGGRGGHRTVPPPRLGRQGGLSMDVPLIPGGSREVLRALGVRGGMTLTFLDSEARDRGAAALAVGTALALLALGFLVRRAFPPLALSLLALAFATAAPAMFGARDGRLLDAVAQGAAAASALFILAGILGLARRLVRRRSAPAAATALLLAALLAGPAFAGPPPPPPAPPSDTVYVPYDPSDPAGLDGAGKVFIPFSRFRELWNAAHPDRRIEKPSEAPVPWLATGAAIRVAVEEETVRLTVDLDLVLLSDGFVQVGLPFAPAVVESATMDGVPVLVLAREKEHVLVLPGPGAKRITLVLRAPYQRSDFLSVLQMPRPAIPRTLLVVEEPFEGAVVNIASPEEPVKDGRDYRALLAAEGNALFVSWGRRADLTRPDAAASCEVETREVLALREGHSALHLWTKWRVVSGVLAEVRFSLDPAYSLVSVHGSDVAGHEVRDGVLVVRIGPRAVQDGTEVWVTVEKADGRRAPATDLPAVAPLDAVRERGLLAVAGEPTLRLTVSGPRNLDRVDARPEDFLSPLLPAGMAVHSAFRFVARPLSLSVSSEPVRAEVKAEVAAQHLIEREWVRSRAWFRFEVRGDGTFEFPLTVPGAAEVEAVTAEGLDRWWRDGDALVVSTASPVRGTFAVEVSWRTPLAPDVVRVDLPEVHALNATRERGVVVVAHAPALSLTTLADEGLTREDVRAFDGLPVLDPRQRNAYAYRHEGETYRLAVARTFPEPRVRSVTVTRLQVEDDRVVVDVLFSFTVANAVSDTFRVFLPAGEGTDPILTAERQRSATFAPARVGDRDGTMLTLTLQQAMLGEYRFGLTYEKMLDSSGRVEIVGLEPQAENPSAFVLAANVSPRGEAAYDRAETLEAIDPAGLPFLPAGMDLRLIQRAWRAARPEWRLPLSLTIYGFAEFPDALITTATMTTAVGRDGWTRNRMTYRVVNRTRQFLELSLPQGAVLESVQVGGRGVKPGRRTVGGEERLLVPLARMQLGDVSTEVEVYWTRAVGTGGTLRDFALLEPRVHGLAVERTFFTVALPEGYRYSFDGNMQPTVKEAQQAWEVEKLTEEFERLKAVQSRGSNFEKARAEENLQTLQREIEERNDQALSALESSLGTLSDKDFEDLNKEQRAELRKQVEVLSQKLRQQEKEIVAARGDDGDVRARPENVYDETRRVAEEQAEQQYRFRGKRNLRAQGWASNAAPQEAQTDMEPGQTAEDFTYGGEEVLKVQGALDRLADNRGAYAAFGFLVVPQGQAGQPPAGPAPATVLPPPPAPPGGGEAPPPPSSGGGDGGGWEGAGRDGGRLAPAPEARAGLLSLSVHVPVGGVVHEFEKLNGGAALRVSVGKPGAGRGLAAFGLFAAVALVLFAAGFFAARRRRRAR